LPQYLVGNQSVDDVPVSSLGQFIQVKVPSILAKPYLPHLFVKKSLKKKHLSGGDSEANSLPHQDLSMVAGSSRVHGDAITDLTSDMDIIGNFTVLLESNGNRRFFFTAFRI
jgi:hypothetical protein